MRRSLNVILIVYGSDVVFGGGGEEGGVGVGVRGGSFIIYKRKIRKSNVSQKRSQNRGGLKLRQ